LAVRPLVLEWAERIALLSLYVWLVVRVMPFLFAGDGNAVNLLLLLSEGIVLLLVLIRRSPKHISARPSDWLVAFSASTVPLLVYPNNAQALIPPFVGVAVMLLGLTIQVHAKLVLGRSFGCVAAHRGLKFSGPYRCVRHPMYLGYLLGHVGFLLLNPTIWNLSAYVLCYSLQIRRLLAEEQLLSQDADYSSYMGQVRFRMIPGVF